MEGDYIYYTPSQNRSISIHSLRMEGDEVKTVGYIATNISIHSPPYGGRPFKSVCPASSNAISIHSLRMEGDVIIQRFRI